jgi:DNA-binding IclR family transcriptional regulator
MNMTNNKEYVKTAAVQLIVVGSVLIVGSAIGKIVLKRQEKREEERLLAHNVAFASFQEVAELFIEQLDDKIERAKKALLDDDFNQIIEDF